ncbi:MAG: hypothetical protein ACK4JE_00955 [Endomicrobiia bacterium]
MKKSGDANNTKFYKICEDSPITTLFFIIGLIATIAIRAIGIAGLFNETLIKILWYIGVIGFLLFFLYKYKTENTRRKILIENNILEKLGMNSELTEKDKVVLTAIMCGLISKKDTINYFVIFFSSTISLVIAVLFDLRIIK